MTIDYMNLQDVYCQRVMVYLGNTARFALRGTIPRGIILVFMAKEK